MKVSEKIEKITLYRNKLKTKPDNRVIINPVKEEHTGHQGGERREAAREYY